MSLRAALAVAAFAVAAPAFAQADPGPSPQSPSAEAPAQSGSSMASSPWAAAREQVRKVCAADLKTYCSDLPEGGRIGRCLRTNFDKLSPDCKTQLEQMRAQRRATRPQ